MFRSREGIVGILLLTMVGCGDYVIKHPFKGLSSKNINIESLLDRGPSINIWMTKWHVLKKWGHPDEMKLVGTTPVWGAPIECWRYDAWLPGFPVNYRYVAKDYKLYFQGEILIKIESGVVHKIQEPSLPTTSPTR